MKIKIKCPSCNAGNILTPEEQQCRRCKEDLGLLYSIKGYSFKYRFYLIELLTRKDAAAMKRKQQLAFLSKMLKK